MRTIIRQRRVAPAARQAGQAMMEFVVAAVFFLVPLFLAIAALGKFTDVQHVTDMSARYGAWERTVWYDDSSTAFNAINGIAPPNQKNAAAIKGEIAARLFSDRSADVTVIKNTDRSNTALVNGIDPMWRDQAGAVFLAEYADLGSESTRETPQRDIAGAIVAKAAAVSVRGVAGFVPPLPNDTLAVSTVSLADLAADSGVYQRLWNITPGGWQGLDFGATGAILSNTWGANGKGATRAMVARTVPTAQAVGAFVTAAKLGIKPWDALAESGIEVGKIEVDVVPGDRLR